MFDVKCNMHTLKYTYLSADASDKYQDFSRKEGEFSPYNSVAKLTKIAPLKLLALGGNTSSLLLSGTGLKGMSLMRNGGDLPPPFLKLS